MSIPLELYPHDVIALCLQWQGVLRLRDWNITITVQRGFRLGSGNWAEVYQQADYRKARISLVHPRDVPPEMLAEYDVEKTIVHELLHLVVQSGVKKFKRNAHGEEFLVESLASSCVQLHRFRPDFAPEVEPGLTILREKPLPASLAPLLGENHETKPSIFTPPDDALTLTPVEGGVENASQWDGRPSPSEGRPSTTTESTGDTTTSEPTYDEPAIAT